MEGLEFNAYLWEGDVAKHWGILPRELRHKDKEEQAELHALYRVQKEREQYYASEQVRKIDQNIKNK